MGGAEKQIVSLANYLKNDYDISLITFKNKNTDFYQLNKKIRRFALNIKSNKSFIFKLIFYINFIFKIRKLFLNLKPNTIVSFLPVPSTIMMISSFGLKSKKIVSIRNNPNYEKINFIWVLFFKYLKKNISKIVIQSKYLGKNIKKNYNYSTFLSIPNFISIPNVVFKKKKIIIPPNKKFILAVGKISDQKGFENLIECFEKLTHKNIYLYILSNSKNINLTYYETLKTKIKYSKKFKKIKILFDITNVDDWYKKCELYVLSSKYEGYPNSLIEALYNNCKVISFDCDYGPREIINFFKAGLLIPANKNKLFKVLNLYFEKKLKINKRKLINVKNYNLDILRTWSGIL